MAQAAADTVDVQSAAAPPAPSDNKTPIDFLDDKSDMISLQRKHVAEDRQAGDESLNAMHADREIAAKYLTREGVGPDDIPKWDAAAEKRKYETNPVESFGSLASIFAITASAFTKAPMENALNGAAAAMHAVRDRDDKAYDQAFGAWKANTDLAIKRHQMMHENYQDAISLMSSDMVLGEAKLKQMAARYGDQKTLMLMEHGYFPEVFQMMDARNKATQGLIQTQQMTDEYTMRKQVADVAMQHAKTPQEKLQTFNDAMGIKTDAEQQWNTKWRAAHPATGDPKADYDSWLHGYKEFKEASSPYSGGADKRTIDAVATQLMDDAEARGEKMSLADARLAAQAKLSQAKSHQQDVSPDQLEKIGWNKDSIDAAARTYNKTGVMPRNLGTRSVAAAISGSIQSRATELMKEDGITPEQRAKNWQTFGAERVAIQRFESGPQGNTIRSLGVVVDHLGTLRQLALLMHNGNIPAFNKMAQEWAEQTGSKVPTNFDEARQIVGTEIIKALGVAGAGTQAERAEAAQAFSRWRSPNQLLGGIDDVMRPLMLGQLKGLERQFVKSTGLGHEEFLSLLGPEAEKFLRPGGDNKSAPASTKVPEPTQKDIDYAKAHPEKRDLFIQRFGRQP